MSETHTNNDESAYVEYFIGKEPLNENSTFLYVFTTVPKTPSTNNGAFISTLSNEHINDFSEFAA